MRIGALEAGGTKMVCAIGDENGTIFEQVSIPTTAPDETLKKIHDYFEDKSLDALGIACFGPIDLNKTSSTYGYITTTPKPGWQHVDIVGAFSDFDIPIGFDTDVNGSMLGEHTYGAARGIDHSIYITIGTGIGVGVMSGGTLLHGMLHPEAGHILINPRPDDPGRSCCPFHTNCFEGLASGPSIEKRWGKSAKELFDQNEVWELEADYIAMALVNMTLTLSPKRIVLGGGVMHQTQLLPLIRQAFEKHLAGYIQTKELKDLDSYIVLQALDDNQGLLGALKLGQLAYDA